MWSFLILVLLDVPHSYEDESINLKSLPTNLSEIQQGPTTSNPIWDSGPYHVPPLSTVCPNPSSTSDYSTIQTDIVYNPNPLLPQWNPTGSDRLSDSRAPSYHVSSVSLGITQAFHVCPQMIFALEDSNLHWLQSKLFSEFSKRPTWETDPRSYHVSHVSVFHYLYHSVIFIKMTRHSGFVISFTGLIGVPLCILASMLDLTQSSCP